MMSQKLQISQNGAVGWQFVTHSDNAAPAARGLRLCAYSSLESVIEQSKESYYLALRQTQGTTRSDEPNWQPWVVYFLKALQSQNQKLEKKIERERIILGDLPELSVNLLELACVRGRITIAKATKLTHA